MSDRHGYHRRLRGPLPTDDNKQALQKSHADLGQQLAVISGRLADVESRLGATSDDLAAIEKAAEEDAAENGPIAAEPDNDSKT